MLLVSHCDATGFLHLRTQPNAVNIPSCGITVHVINGVLLPASATVVAGMFGVTGMTPSPAPMPSPPKSAAAPQRLAAPAVYLAAALLLVLASVF